MGYMANMVAIAGIILPFSLMVLFAIFTCASVHMSGMLKEDRDKGDQGVVGQMMRASTQSISGRPSQSSGTDLTRSISQNSGINAPAAVPLGAGYGDMHTAALGLSLPATAIRGASVPSTGPPPNIGIWQVDMDHGRWKDFDEAQQRAFSTAVVHGLDKVEFTLAHQRYELVFAEEVQRNLRTSKTRRIRCATPAEAAQAAAAPPAAAAAAVPRAVPVSGDLERGSGWQVQMDSGKWVDMEGVVNTIINDAKSRGDASVFFRTHGHDIELSFEGMIQRNTKTNKERPIREKPGGGPSRGGVPSPAAGSVPNPMPAGDSANPPQDDSEHVQM